MLFYQQKLRIYDLQETLFQFWKDPSHLSTAWLQIQEAGASCSLPAQETRSAASFQKAITTDSTYWTAPNEHILSHALGNKTSLSSFLYPQIHIFKWKIIIYQHSWGYNKSSCSATPIKKNSTKNKEITWSELS